MTKGHQIAFPVVAAFGDRDDVMHFLDGSVASFLEAAFTQRVGGGIAVTDSFPSPAVFLVAVGRPFVTVVILPHGFPVFLAIGTVR